MPRINDAKLRNLYDGIARARAQDGRSKIALKDLDSILSTVGDRRGLGADDLKAQLEATGDRDQKIALAKEGLSASERRDLKTLLSQDAVPITPAARKAFEKLLGTQGSSSSTPTAGADVFRVETGRMAFRFSDDKVFFGRDGKVKSSSGVKGYTRGYAATVDGPLRFRHGSAAPSSTALSAAARRAIDKRTPGAALDRAAKVFESRAYGFEEMASHEDFYDPSAAGWEGKCHAWSWAALSKEVCDLVDVKGPVGERGLWIGGEWLSRADLGNWMMGVAHIVSLADGDSLFDEKVTPEDLLKAVGQYMMFGGGGVVADIHNDAREGTDEVWNQPFVAAEVRTETLKGRASAELLCQAREDGVTGAHQVKLVRARGKYVDEGTDDHEDKPELSARDWNMYAVVDKKGELLKAYMADDPALSDLTWLPLYESDATPDLFRRPKLKPIKDVLDGETNWSVESVEYGWNFEFFVDTVLLKGIPAKDRAAFEDKVAAMDQGQISPREAARLAKRFPGMANAYSPKQWEDSFGSRGLDADAFGAAWQT